MEMIFFVFLAIAAYVLPGYTFLRLVGFRGTGELAKCILAIPVSLVLVPFLLALIGHFFPFIPSLWQLLLITIIFLGLEAATRKWRHVPWITVFSRNEGLASPSRLEWIAVSACILGFSLLINLHRLEMFIHGHHQMASVTIDEFRHFTVLISVARSGIPPHNYFFPDIQLVYYYWSQIYPAAIANQSFLAISLARAFAFHAFLQTASFLVLIYGFLRLNAKSWLARASGLSFVTLFAGFDYFASEGHAEWWQKSASWLVSPNEIFSLPMLYIYAPQHLAGGMAFVLALFLWKNIRSTAVIRFALLGILMAFTFGTSPFVFLGFGVAVVVWAWEYRRLLSKRILLPAVAFAIPFFLGWIPQLILTMSSSGEIVLSKFRVPFLESFLLIETAKINLLDKILTYLHFPVVLFWILLIEIGLPFILYGGWVFLKSWRHRLVWNRFAILYPLAIMLVVSLWMDQDGGTNFARRGLIPMQIVIALAAALSLKNFRGDKAGESLIKKKGWLAPHRIRAALLVYILLTFASAQSVTWWTSGNLLSIHPIGCAFRVEKPVNLLGFSLAACTPIPGSLSYISWLNRNTPVEALIVEENIPTVEDRRFRFLERMRFLNPADAKNVYDFRIELEVTRPKDLESLSLEIAARDVLAMALKSKYYQQMHPPVFFVARIKKRTQLGTPVYEDEHVTIYRVPEGYDTYH